VRLNQSGNLYLTHTRLDDRAVIRISVGQTRTDGRHVARLWELIDELAPPV